MEREDDELIRKLANSFGMANPNVSKYASSRYDAATGTLYCEGISIPKATVKRALDHFEKQKDYFRVTANTDPGSMEQYLMNVVAHNAILMLVNSLEENKE